MSSIAQSVQAIKLTDYATIAVLTAVGYDYVLTLPSEINHIWSKPWTRISTLFMLVRYCGLYDLAMCALLGSSFIPGPPRVCQILNIIHQWTCMLFLVAADFVMILRAWAMYNRSTVVLSTLLALLFAEAVTLIVDSAVYSYPRHMPMATVQILDYSYCAVELKPRIWGQVTDVMQITFATVLCTFALVQFIKQSLQSHRETKQWQLNRYMTLLVKQGMIYFFAIFLVNLIDVLNTSGKLPLAGSQITLSYIPAYVALFSLTPRFIISVRELHTHTVRGGRAVGIDTGFGFSAISSSDVLEAEMIFADVEPDELTQFAEEITMEDVPGIAQLVSRV
ncbi:hypothetical protein JVU11DRAFT_10418 [Chiua virens]|nr:hypothetical protein JVU11DRAFT_10418 [Chiua virens]